MSAWLSVEGDDPDGEFARLSDWLSHEDELRGQVIPEVAAPGPGELGALTDVLVAAVASGGAISVLAASLKAYLSQPRRSDVRIVVRGVDGRRVELDAKRVNDVESLLRQTLGQPE